QGRAAKAGTRCRQGAGAGHHAWCSARQRGLETGGRHGVARPAAGAAPRVASRRGAKPWKQAAEMGLRGLPLSQILAEEDGEPKQRVMRSADLLEGIQAFFGKRAPRWQGR